MAAYAQHRYLWALPLLGIASALSLLEIGFRARHATVRSIPFLASMQTFSDPELGWAPEERSYRAPADRPVLMIVGDSFTHGLSVPRGDLYDARLAAALPATVHTLAAPGYGTAQSYLGLVRLLRREGAAEIVLLQLCSNDLINNSWQLESASHLQNAELVRPYFEDGAFVYRYSRDLGVVLRAMTTYSRTAHFLKVRSDELRAALSAKRWITSVEQRIGKDARVDELVTRSRSVTTALLRRIAEVARGSRIIAFQVDDVPTLSAALSEALHEAGIEEARGWTTFLATREGRGVNLRLPDNVHLNGEGHALLAEWLRTAIATST